MSERMPATALREGYLRLIDQSPTPDSLPAYDRMLIDRDGALWLREYRAPPDVRVAWNVFDRSGRWLTRVDLPAQLDVRDIGADYLIAITRDSLDVELVRLYRLTRPSAAPPASRSSGRANWHQPFDPGAAAPHLHRGNGWAGPSAERQHLKEIET
jgi:hypothetical protein